MECKEISLPLHNGSNLCHSILYTEPGIENQEESQLITSINQAMELTAQELAHLVNGTVEGDARVKVREFAKIEQGHPGALSFLANPKYEHYIYQTQSSIVLVQRDFKPLQPIAATLVRVEDPYATIASLLKMVEEAHAMAQPKGIEEPSFIAPGVSIPEDAYVGAFAYISPGCKLGEGVKIYPQVFIGHDCKIGAGTVIYPGVKIYHGCVIGSRCILHAGAVIGADGFGFAPNKEGVYEKIPQTGYVEIGDDVEIGANTTIDRAMMGATKISHGAKLDNQIQIAHNCTVGENTVMAAHVGMAGSAKIGAGCMVGGQAGISGHIAIGDNVQIGAQSGVTHDISAGARILGSPAVDAHEFARSLVWVKRIPKIMEQLKKIEETESAL